jgi:hypothetical protein
VVFTRPTLPSSPLRSNLIIIARNPPLFSTSSTHDSPHKYYPSFPPRPSPFPLLPPSLPTHFSYPPPIRVSIPMKRPLSDKDAPLRSDGSSNSIDDSTDTETDLGPSGASSAQNTRQVREKMLGDGAPPSTPPLPPPPPPPPAKKKRTRTLTTPHQSAVLHALLAQVSTSDWARTWASLRLFSVPLSNHCHARRSRSVDWVECSKGPGAFRTPASSHPSP